MLTPKENWGDLDRLSGALKAYQIASGKTLAYSMINTAGVLASSLHKETKKISPSEEKLRSVAGSTPSKSGDKKGMWAIKRKGGGAWAEIFRRIRKKFYQAAGWVPAIKGTRERGRITSFARPIGGIEGHVDDNGVAIITMWNRALGIAETTEKYKIMRKAITRTMLNFSSYIKRKLGEDAQKAFWKI